MIDLQTMPFYFAGISKQRHILHRGGIFMGRYIFRDDTEDIQYNKICSKFMNASVKRFLIRIVITTICLIAMTYGPTYAFFIQNIPATGFDLRLPFTDEKSNEEFFGILMFQFILATYGALGLVGMEIAMELFVGMISIVPTLLEYEFRKMDEKIAKNEFNVLELRLTFRNIVQQIMDTDK